MPTEDQQPPRDYFATTHWSVVQLAARHDTTRAQQALSKLCETYWYPLYACVRRQGHKPEDAQDLTQEFFARLLAKDFLASVNPGKGKFRSFLLASLKHFLANEWDRARAAKRGGGRAALSLDAADAETRYRLEPIDELSADRIFDRRWAMTLLERVVQQLQGEFERDGKAALFEQLKIVLIMGKGAVSYGTVASNLGTSEGAVKVAAHRMRQRYRELLRGEVAQTVSSAADVDEELRNLFAALRS